MPRILDIMYGSMEAGYHRELDNNFWRDWSEFTRKYVILGDTLDQDETAILTTPNLPRLGSPLYNCICDSAKAHETDRVIHPATHVPCGLWEVECHFTNNFVGDQDQEEDDPTQYLPVWSVDGDTEEEHLRLDYNNRPVVNSVGDPLFAAGKTTVGVLKIVRYEYYPFNLGLFFAYGNRLNSVNFWGAPKGTCLMLPMGVENVWLSHKNAQGNTVRAQFSRVTYTIQVKAKGSQTDTWQANLLDEGYQCREKPGGPVVVAKDAQGHSGGMVNLKADGTIARDITGPNGPHYIRFETYDYADFNILNLGPY